MTNQLNDDQTRNSQLDEIRDSGLKENNALRVHSYLRANERARSRRLPRWIWELLQNALDASIAHDDPLTVKIEYNLEELIFLHNGSSFEEKQIFNLIYHGSTKADREEAIGEYGSGFLTTHLLSPEIEISGQLSSKEWFDFCLTRKSDSPDALLDLMDEAWENFKASLSTSDQSIPAPFTTRFIYPIMGREAQETVEKGIETLKQCTPFVLVFNSKFSSIDINNHGETLRYEVIKRRSIEATEIQHITVTACQNGNSNENKYVLISDKKKTSVAVPLASNSNGSACQPVKKIPRLFKAVPLVGTESFSFPAVINSLDFKPSEDRDDVYIGLGNDEANTKNQSAIEKSCELLVHLLQYAASEGWYNVHQWTEVPTLQHPTEETREWIRTCVRENLIEEIRKNTIVLNEDENLIDPENVKFLSAGCESGVQTLWDLCESIKGQRKFLPKREEATGWCNAIRSWADVYQDEPMSLFSEVRDGVKLASFIQKNTHKDGNYGKIEDLQNLLREDVPVVEWLNRLHEFFNENNLREEVIEYHIVIDQSGYLDKLSALHRDPGIDIELKEIAEKLDWEIRQELRDNRLTSLTEEEGKGDMKQDQVVDTISAKLRTRADENPDLDFKKASTLLFAWIVNQGDWNLLNGFPLFAKEDDSDKVTIIHLPHPSQDNIQNNECPLAPVLSWENDLQDYWELFPRRYILADILFKAAPDPDIWEMLKTKGFIRKNVIVHDYRNISFETFLPHVPLTEEDTHETKEEISVSDIAFLTKTNIGIIDRVRKSLPLARKFWRFLTEWLTVHDPKGLEIINVSCTCGQTHDCYPAERLVPVVNRKWVPLGENKADNVKAETLANLLRGSEWDPSAMSENDPICYLLEAIGVSHFDLMRETFVNHNDREAVDNAIIEIMRKSKGNVSHLNHTIKYIEAMTNNETIHNDIEQLLDLTKGNLSQVLEDIREHKEQQNKIAEIQSLGKHTEKWVKESLEQAGFSVSRTGTGSDFEVSAETFDLPTQEMVPNDNPNDRKWLVEVKGTRVEYVKMSSEQTKTAVKKRKKYLLCVVPIPENTEVDFQTVKQNMKFVKNIHKKFGDRVTKLCQSIKEQETLLNDTLDDTSSDVELDFERGRAEIRVKNSVWENEGIRLEDLIKHLK